MSWRPAQALEVLRDEVNARWPARNKDSDGMIGDAAHAASASDHNPNAAGVVCALDITHDPNGGPDGNDLAERLRARRHPDAKYVIWNRQIASAYPAHGSAPWEWRAYSGADPHTNHVHVSVGVGPDGQSQPPYDDSDPWLEENDDMTEQQIRDLFAAISRIDNALNDPTNGALARLVVLENAVNGDAEDDANATSGLSVQLKEIRRNVRRVGRATNATGIEGAMPNP